ncbi:MAG: VTT domain-containing protein [Roseomonas sp.]|jgi:membrane protein DedA with SNARE-associated domain|nr:VTT domain-containing protein [Roseomonas sp.]MCA3315394.1 VTT domain-containing protein [Roseomonas sp.]
MEAGTWIYATIFVVAFSEAFVVSNAFTPGGPALVAMGGYAGLGQLNFFMALLAAAAGTFVGAALSFFLAEWIFRVPYFTRNLQRLQQHKPRLSNRPFLYIIIAHFLPGLGSAVFVLMATVLPWRVFCAMEALAALVSAAAHLLLGYALATLPILQALGWG